MQLTGSTRLLIAALAVLSTLTLVLAAAVLVWHSWSTRREARVAREGQRLAIAFARFLTGQVDATALRSAAAAVRPDVFWTAMETFADSVGGEEWARLSSALHGLDHVLRERRRIVRGRAWPRALAARHLGMLDDPANLRPLRSAMATGTSTVTLTAALGLARMHDHAALVWLLDHSEALQRLTRHQLVALIKRFGRDSLPTLRFGLAAADFERPSGLAAVDVLGLWRDTESRIPLETLMAEGGLEVRIAAARALGGIGELASTEALCAALRDAAWQVRAQAAKSLAAVAAPAALVALTPCLRDMSWWVRRNAAYALGALGDAGQAELAAIAARSDDRFARDAANEVLQALEWERESPGGVSRVG